MRRTFVVVLSLLACVMPAVGAAAPFGRTSSERTQRITVTETAGVPRTGYPVEVAIRYESDAVENPADLRLLRLLRVSGEERTSVPFQVLSVDHPNLTNQYNPKPHTFARIAFLADVPANGQAVYEIADAGPAAERSERVLSVTGEGVGKTIDTGSVTFELHPTSGQLRAYNPKFAGEDRLIFNQGNQDRAVHWNPDVFAPPAGWGHTRGWATAIPFGSDTNESDAGPDPYHYREWTGPVLHRLTRWGRMQGSPEVDASVSYTFFAGAPFALVSSGADFRAGKQVQAVRNCEFVFSRKQHTHGVWIDGAGVLHTVPLADPEDEDNTLGLIKKLPADTPCIGLANEEGGYGMALVMMGTINSNRFTGATGAEQSHFYFLDYGAAGRGSPANFTYFCRAVAYRENYTATYVPEGSRFATKYWIVVFPLGASEENRYDALKQWYRVLSNPLIVTAD